MAEKEQPNEQTQKQPNLQLNLKRLTLNDDVTKAKLQKRMELQNKANGKFNKEIHILKSLAAFEVMKANMMSAFFGVAVSLFVMIMTVIQNKYVSYAAIIGGFIWAFWMLMKNKPLRLKYQW